MSEINLSGGLRACSDCERYAIEYLMIKKADGRVICSDCQRAIEQKAQSQAQADLFVSQPVLF